MIAQKATRWFIVILSSLLAILITVTFISLDVSKLLIIFIVSISVALIVFSIFNFINTVRAEEDEEQFTAILDHHKDTLQGLPDEGGSCWIFATDTCYSATMNCQYRSRSDCENNRNPIDTCFPGHATVETPTGRVAVKNLKRGSLVLDSSGKFNPIIFTLHQDDSIESYFVEITVRDMNGTQYKLTQTDYHYALVNNNQRVYAKDLAIGDIMHAISGPAVVTSVRRRKHQGLYAPYTENGTIYIDGVLTSCYSNFWYDNPKQYI